VSAGALTMTVMECVTNNLNVKTRHRLPYSSKFSVPLSSDCRILTSQFHFDMDPFTLFCEQFTLL
jgi:hypothetical protein